LQTARALWNYGCDDFFERREMLMKQIGETSGVVWALLREKGPMTLTALKRQVKAPADVVVMALGWLAREDKLAVERKGRVELLRLK
jgi:hypothetical protein